MKIATWNVNSLKSRLEIVLDWLGYNQPDFLLLQEIKGLDESLFLDIKAAGYHSYYNLQKTYNGVAILSKNPCQVLLKALPNFEDTQARIIEITQNHFSIINVYIPNGNPIETDKYTYKIKWLYAFYEYIKSCIENEKSFVIGGDFNIAPKDIDVYSVSAFKNDALVQKEVRDIYFSLINLGLLDVIDFKYKNKEKIYTWWDYRNAGFAKNNGVRIDHILLSPLLADKYIDCNIDQKPRTKDKPSDHTPVICELDL
jgi:exodeoxyribonuclease-3